MFNLYVDFKSFFKEGISNTDDDFSIQLITGYQGSGKTYFGVYEIERLFKGKTIFTNIHSYIKSGNNRVVHFDTISQLYIHDYNNCVYLIDELSKKYTKNSPQDLQFYSWLQQSRKHKRHVFLITQEYIQVPTWLRGIANTVFVTEKVKLLPIFKTTKGIPTLDDDTMEWGITPISSIYYKRTKQIASLYDTFETVYKL